MAEMLRDGTGSGELAKISGNRLFTNSVTKSEAHDANEIGASYNINTGIFTLTDDAETPIIYFKNNEDQNFVIEAVVFGSWVSTDASAFDGVPKLVFLRNPSAGTVVSSPVNVDINSNRNYGSQNTATVDAYKGATGKTITDGEEHIIVGVSNPSSLQRSFISISEIIPKGASFAVKYTPPTGNTNQKIYCAIIGYLESENE